MNPLHKRQASSNQSAAGKRSARSTWHATVGAYSIKADRQDNQLGIAVQLLGSGKLVLSLDELVHATPWSRRTIRRAEIKGELVALKMTRTKAYLVSDVLAWLQRIR